MNQFRQLAILILVIFSGCNESKKGSGQDEITNEPYKLRQTIYHGGDIVTMAGDSSSYVEAVVQREGKIIFTGSKEDALARFEGKADLIDLEGKTMLPGFVDGHGHVFNVGLQAASANLLPAPDGNGNSVEALQKILKEWIKNNQDFITTTGWVLGFGYDDSQLDRYPTKEDLDAVSTDVPIYIIHQSGHLSVVNSKALELAGYSAETKDPKGGKIRRIPGSNEPNGVLEEVAHFMVLITKILPQMTPELQDEMLVKGQKLYASFG
ncbi:MAG: amidohydrolase family protein, partial [Flavobacteriales bacterium]|nr:amidohydrolase family protein [Flavobacteriales bacterium]